MKKCDVCKINFPDDPQNKIDNDFKEFISINHLWGYFSNKDQQKVECIICEDCWDKIDEYIETLGGKIRKYTYDLITGEIIGDYKKEIFRIKKQNDIYRRKRK